MYLIKVIEIDRDISPMELVYFCRLIFDLLLIFLSEHR